MSADGTNVKGKAAIAGLLATKVRFMRLPFERPSHRTAALSPVCSSLVDQLRFVTLQMMRFQAKQPAALLCLPQASSCKAQGSVRGATPCLFGCVISHVPLVCSERFSKQYLCCSQRQLAACLFEMKCFARAQALQH